MHVPVQSNQALLAERHNLRKKNKSLGRDLKKLIHAMGQSVPKAEVSDPFLVVA